ncbi:MAG: transporter [Candidatus Desulfofervidaceae bacterium]|nr:transporter [Candidatus Desulfofervidaceae bacterium]
MRKIFFILILLSYYPALGFAASVHPLGSLDAHLLPQAQWEFRLGTKYTENRWFPFEGRNTHRHEWQIPKLNLDIGVADNVELNFSYPYIYLDSDHTSGVWDSGDLTVGLKIRLFKEKDERPVLTLNLKTKLPNGDYSKRFSTNETDFFSQFLLAKTWRNLNVFLNGGLGIIGKPNSCNSQDDVFIYGLGVTYTFSPEIKMLADINGWAFSADDNNYATLTFGGQYYLSPAWRLDGGLHFGLSEESENWGLSVGITYIFHWRH